MRAYTHRGHGPRADQTGRIHISDFRFPRTNSLAISSRSIHLGQKPAFELWSYARGSEAVGGMARKSPWTLPLKFVGLGTRES